MPKFVVVADAVTVATGEKNAKGRVQYARVAKGGILNGAEDAETIRHLLHKKSIVKAKSKEHAAELGREFHRTARVVSQVQGAPDDPVQAPVEGVAPLPAPLPGEDPDAILAGPQGDAEDIEDGGDE